MKHVCIVGAGISGLMAGYRLQKEGIACTILEAQPHPGGVMRSVHEKGYVVECGPHTLQMTPEVQQLLEEIGLMDSVVQVPSHMKTRFTVYKGQLEPLPSSPPKLFKTPLLRTRDKLRMLADVVLPRTECQQVSMGSFIEARFGKAVVERFLDPFISGVFAGDPYALSLEHTLPSLWSCAKKHRSLIVGMMRRRPKPPAIISFKGGLEALPKRLAQVLGHSIVYNACIQKMEYTGAHAWRVRYASPMGVQEHTFTDLWITVPGHVLHMLPLDSALRVDLAGCMRVPYAPVSCWTHAFKRLDVQHALDGFGFLAPSCERFPVLGTLFMSSLFPHYAPSDHVLLSTFVGGVRHPERVHDAKDMNERIIEALRPLLGIKACGPLHTWRHLWPKAIPQYTLSHGALLEDIQHVEAQYAGLKLLGTYRTHVALSRLLGGCSGV